MRFYFEPMLPEHQNSVIDIFNYYVENSFAAYPESKVPYDVFDIFLEMSDGYPTITLKDEIGEIRSINFHRKNGCIECGRFKNVGRKKGQVFDTVWMQKMI